MPMLGRHPFCGRPPKVFTTGSPALLATMDILRYNVAFMTPIVI